MADMTTAEAARVLGVTPATVRAMARDGKLRAKQTPYGRLFAERDVERLRQERAAVK